MQLSAGPCSTSAKESAWRRCSLILIRCTQEAGGRAADLSDPSSTPGSEPRPGEPWILQRESTTYDSIPSLRKASLDRLVREKKCRGERFNDFADLLELKERSLARRREQVKEIRARSEVPEE